MFLSIHPPIAPKSASGAAPFGTTIHDTSDYFGTPITAQSAIAVDNISTFIVEDAVTTDSVVSFVASPLADNITAICIGDRPYTLAKDKDNPQPGEFTFDFYSKAIAVYLVEGDNLDKDSLIYKAGISLATDGFQGDTVNYLTPANLGSALLPTSFSLPSTDICNSVEPLLERWNAIDNVLKSDRWNSSPTFSFTFKSCRDQIDLIKAELGNETFHTAFDNRWVTDGDPTIEYRKHGQITVTINLIHWLAARGNPSRSLLDKELFLKKKTGTNSYKRVRTIAEFAQEAGVNYQGAEIRVRVPRSVSSSATTTLRSLLQQYSITAHGWIDYTAEGVELVPWKEGKTIVINEDQVKSESVLEDPQGNGNRLNGVPLHTEWRNSKVDLDFAEESENEGITTDWRFINCRDLTDFFSPREDRGFYFRSPSVEILRNPTICFDVGGAFTKQAILTTRMNGTPTFEVKHKAGYFFTSAETHLTEVTSQGGLITRLNTATFPSTYWGQVSKTVDDWIFNHDNYNYLERIEITGTEKARLRQESDRLEAAELKGKAALNPLDQGGILVPDPSFTAQAEAYEFSEELPINDLTTYKLARLQDHYDDIVKPGECLEEDFIDPQFMVNMTRFRQDKFIKDNPENTDQITYPPIEYGKYLKETTTVKITETGEQAKYEVITTRQTNEGERFRNSITESNTTYHDDKPPVHTRLDYQFDYQFQDLSAIANRERYQNENYYLSSPGVIGKETRTNEQGKGYADVDDPNDVLAIARTELSIINTLNSLPIDIIILPRNDMRKGDFALFRGRRWKILDIVDARSLDSKKQRSDRLGVKLGLYLEPGLELENRRYCGQ